MDERIELLRRGYASYNRGDPDYTLFHPDVTILQAAEILGTAGEFAGRAGVRACFDELLEGFNPSAFEPQKFEPLDDGRMLVRCRWSGRGVASGIEVDGLVWHVFAFRDGLVSRMEVYASKGEAQAALGESASSQPS
jgi:ketosteroid isomerase-like protein